MEIGIVAILGFNGMDNSLLQSIIQGISSGVAVSIIVGIAAAIWKRLLRKREIAYFRNALVDLHSKIYNAEPIVMSRGVAIDKNLIRWTIYESELCGLEHALIGRSTHMTYDETQQIARAIRLGKLFKEAELSSNRAAYRIPGKNLYNTIFHNLEKIDFLKMPTRTKLNPDDRD